MSSPFLHLGNATTNGCRWYVGDLSVAFNRSNYQRLVISIGTTTNGSTTAPTGQLTQTGTPSSGTISGTAIIPPVAGGTNSTRTWVEGNVTGLLSGTTYTLYAYAQDVANGRWWLAGSATITTTVANTAPTVNTAFASQIDDSGAWIGGQITSTGGLSTTRHIRIGTSSNNMSTIHNFGSTTTAGDFGGFIFGLNHSTTYFFQAYGTNSMGTGEGFVRSFTTLSPPPPDTPTNFRITSRTTTSITVAWSSVSGATSYNLFRDGTYVTAVAGTSYTFTGLSGGSSYLLEVNAFNGTSHSTRASISSATTLPNAPTNLQINATLQANNTVNCALSWTAPSGNVDGYDVYRTNITNGGTVYLGYKSGKTNTSHADNGVLPNTEYQYGIYAIYNGQSSSGLLRNITTPSNRPQNWNWSYTIASGNPVHSTVFSGGQIIGYLMPATEWNNFTDRVNAFRRYKNLTNHTFTTVSSNTTATIAILNQAVTAINGIGYSIPQVNSSGNNLASVLNQMRDTLNSIV